MISRIGNTLSLLAILVATAAAAQQKNSEQYPHIPAMMHQQMIHDGKVIYDADVDQNDPTRQSFALKVKIDDLYRDCDSTVGNVAGSSESNPVRGSKASEMKMVGCVVKEISPDGFAKADVIYAVRDPARNVDKSGHVSAVLQVGKPYETISNGSHVTLLLQTY